MRGKLWNLVLRYSLSPPDEFRVEVLQGEGPMVKGSYWENSYAETPQGTLISTRAEILISPELKVPRFLQGWIVKRVMSRADKEDLVYFKKMKKEQA